MYESGVFKQKKKNCPSLDLNVIKLKVELRSRLSRRLSKLTKNYLKQCRGSLEEIRRLVRCFLRNRLILYEISGTFAGVMVISFMLLAKIIDDVIGFS